MNLMTSPEKRIAQPDGKLTSCKTSHGMALMERPLTIGCCQSSSSISPHSEKMRNQTNDPRPPHLPSPLTPETNYEGRGASPQRLPPKRPTINWWGSPMLSDLHSMHSRRQRQRSGHSSGSSMTDDGGMSVIDKEDLLDTIFISCDVQGKGRVPVSKVIEHIQMIVESHESKDIDELALQLDPTGLDLEIDLETYQNGIAQWIKNIQNQRKLEVSDREAPNAHPCAVNTPETAPHWKRTSLDGSNIAHLRSVSTPLSETRSHWKTRNSESSHLFGGLMDSSLDLSTCSYGSLEAQGGDSTPDMADLQNRIEDLQFQIRRLNEHNMKLQTQIQATDEANELLISQIETLKGELKSVQQAWHRSQSFRDENEELKSSNKEWQKKHAQLEKEKQFLDDKIASLQIEAKAKNVVEKKLQDVQEQLSISLAEYDSMQDEHRKLQAILQDYKSQTEESDAHLEVKNAELAEKAKRCKEMQANLEEVYGLNRVLKAEKSQIEVKLSEVRQELDSYQTQQLIAPREDVPTASPTSSRTESVQGRSLHSELKSLVSTHENLPSPICGNEDFDFENHIGSSSSAGSSSTTSPLSRQPSFISTSTTLATKVLVHFRQRKDEVMRQLHGFLDENANEEHCAELDSASSKLAFTQLLETELDSMMDKMTSLVKSKKQSEQRASKLSFMLQSLQDDYLRITKKYEEAIKHCKEMTATKSELEHLQSEKEMLQFDLQREKHRGQELETNLSSCQQDLGLAHEAQQKYRQMAETQLGELKRLFKEMEKKYKIAQDSARNQEASYKSTIAQQSATHRAQLKSLLDPVNTSCIVADQLLPLVTQDTGKVEPLHDNKQLLESLSAYLTGLKTQLAEVKGQVISLKREKFSLKHGPLHLKRSWNQKVSCHQPSLDKITGTGCICNKNREYSSLLDALTLEVIAEDSHGHCKVLLLNHQSAQSSDQQLPRLSQDDTLVNSLRDSPATLIHQLHHNLVREFNSEKKGKSQTVSTQTEILRTPDRQLKPYARSSHTQTGVTATGAQNRDTDTQTEIDGFKSFSYRTSDGADVRQAYLVNKSASTSGSSVLLAVTDGLSVGDSASDLSDSFITACSSPIYSPRKGSLQDSVDREGLLGSSFRHDSLDTPYSPPDQGLSEGPETNANTDPEIQSLNRKSVQDRQEAAQRMADMLASSYARPNIMVEGCQADSEDNDLNANYDRSGKFNSSTPRKLSPGRLKRRTHTDKDKDKRTPASGHDTKGLDHLLTDDLSDVDMTEEEKNVSQRLLEAAKKASERHKTRRGRRWSPSNSPDQRSPSPNPGDRSPSPISPPALPIPDDQSADTPVDTCTSSSAEVVPTTDKGIEAAIDGSGEIQEERTGAEGESDKEDSKLITKSERKDSEAEVIDIKADILKATGSLQAEVTQVKATVPLAQLREEHKQQRKSNIHFTMPELTEATESDPTRESITTSTSNTSLSLPRTTPVPQSPGPENQFNLKEDCTNISQTEGEKEREVLSSLAEEKSVLPDAILSKLGLKVGNPKDTNIMTENEIEDKFNSLQLAFKANQYTLQKRVILQHRQRDLAEKNIEMEIEGLFQTLQLLEPLASVDTVSRDYIKKIRQHADVLQSSSLRLSSRAEGFGAVQQEGRLSRAADVMISHVENLKRLFEREHAELEDARKLLQENRKLFRGNSITNNLSIDGETDSKLLSRRALSMSGGSSKKPTSLFQLAKMLKNPSRADVGGASGKGKPVVTTQIHHQSVRVQPYNYCDIRKRAVSCVISPRIGASNAPFPEFDNETGRRRASVATVVGSGLLSSSYGSQPLSFGGQHVRSQTDTTGLSFSQVSRLAGAVRRTSVQLSSSLNTEDFKEAKARLSLSSTRHTSQTDSPTIIQRRASDDSQSGHRRLDGRISAPMPSPSSPLSSPLRRDAVSLPTSPIEQPSPKLIDPEAVKKGLTKTDSDDAKSSKKDDEVFREGYEQGIRTQVTQELADLREQQKVFCDNLEDLIDQAEEEEEQTEAVKENQKGTGRNRIIRRLQDVCQLYPRARRITRLIFTVSVFLFALVFIITTVVPLESCLNGSPVIYSPWRTLKEVLWPYTELRHHNPPPR